MKRGALQVQTDPRAAGPAAWRTTQGRGAPRLLSPPPDAQGPLTSPFSSYLNDFTFFLGKKVLRGWHALG